MAKFPIVIFILLAAQAAYAMIKPSSSAVNETTRPTSNFDGTLLNENSFNKKLDEMLAVENTPAVEFYFFKADTLLNGAKKVIIQIQKTIRQVFSYMKHYINKEYGLQFYEFMDIRFEKKLEKDLNGTLPSDGKESEIIQKKFREWVRSGHSLAKKYENSTMHIYSDIKNYQKTISTIETVFDDLRSYKVEVAACFGKPTRFFSFVSKSCKNQLARKIMIAAPVVDDYRETVGNLQEFVNQIIEDKILPNMRKEIPPEYLDFHLRGLQILPEGLFRTYNKL